MLKRRSDVELDILEAFESFLKNTIGQPVNKMFVEALKECGGMFLSFLMSLIFGTLNVNTLMSCILFAWGVELQW